MTKLHYVTVLGLHPDTLRRVVVKLDARSAAHAITQVRRDYPGLLVAGVVTGWVSCEDTGSYAQDTN